jgi:hypothetical protein
MIQYKLQKIEGKVCCVTIVGTMVSIPFDPANTDYAEYLKWLDAGNTPLLAEGNAPSGADTPLPAETPDAS